MKQIVGILLAAGRSKRFGADKRLHPLDDGTPMALASALRLAQACRRSIVVIRPGDRALASLLATKGLETVVCKEADQGMGHSLSRGIAASINADGWLIALADMPYIAPASYQAVLEALQNGASLARTTYLGQMGHPVGFGASYLPELLALTGDQGGKALLDAHRVELHCCPVADPGILKDIDQPIHIYVPGHATQQAPPSRLTGLPAITSASTRLLVLGSFAGAASLARQQYYAHPHNQFWRILQAIWPSSPCPESAGSYEKRINWLLERGLGLWDVYASCERIGSLDAAIRKPEVNDIASLACRCPQLRAIAHNGGESYKHARHTAALGWPVYKLPSSSPANASWSFERKLAAWREVMGFAGLL